MISFSLDDPVLRSAALILGFTVAGLLAGVVLEKIFFPRIRKLAALTKWEGDDIVLASIHGYVMLWGALTGCYAALLGGALPLDLSIGLQKVIVVIGILTISLATARVASGFIELYVKRNEGMAQSVTIFRNVTRLVVLTVGLLMILQHLGISVTPILTALGVGGLAVALALQDTLSNLFAGVQLLASKKVKPGDYVQLDSGQEGYVTDVTWRNTTIRALPNNLIIVPNAKLGAAVITNFYRPEKDMAVLIQVGVSYDSDLAKVERVTIEVGREVMQSVSGGVPDFSPFIRYHTFADFSINFTVILRAKEYVDQYLVKHEFVKRLHERYKAEGIEIPFPIRTLHLRQSAALKSSAGENETA